MNGLLIFALIVCFIVNNSEGIESIDPFAKDISKSINFATTNRWNEAKDILEQILKVEPKHFDANQLYGKKTRQILYIKDDLFKYFLTCRVSTIEWWPI